MAVTMKDIALKAGVTRSAVSAVLNDTTASRVSKEKRENILKISRELNYHPNFAATALKKRQTGLLGLICGDLISPFFSELTMAMTEVAKKRGYKVMLTILPWEEQLDMKYLDRMLNNMCDGVFMCHELKPEQASILQQQVKLRNIPFVMLESDLDDISSVSFDYQIGMEKAFEELLAKGHRKIAHAGHPGDIHKWNEYRACCSHYKLEPVEYYFKWDNNFSDAIECGARIANSRERQSALISTDFAMGMLISGMDSENLSIPDELSVIAFNDTMQSRFFRPPLTSVSLNTKLMARYGLDIMLDLINNKDSAKIKSVVIPPELMRRKSVRNFK